MTCRTRGGKHWCALAGAAMLATVATVAGSLELTMSTAFASTARHQAAATTTVPGSNCAGGASGSFLSRTGWTATSNARSSKADVPANAIDGKMTTRFSTNHRQEAGLYFQVDMGFAVSFDAIEMETPHSPGDYARNYEVQAWRGHSWVTVASCAGTGPTEIVSFPTQLSGYVRVVLTGAGSNWWSIDEFNVLASPIAGTSCTAAPSGSALPRTGWLASSNAHYTKANAPANALDGNLTTRFSTNAHQALYMNFVVNMEAPQSFDEVEMDVPNSPTDYARGYDVEVWSGRYWVIVASCTGTGTPEVVSFPTQASQYVRVVLTAKTGFYWWSIDEFNVYTSTPIPVTTTTTPTTVPPTTVPPTTTTTVPPTTVPPTTTTTVPPTTTTTVPPTTTTTPPNPAELRQLKALAALRIARRTRELAGAIKGVQDRPWLGADGTSLVSIMESDISGLEMLGNKIQADTTISEAQADMNLIYAGFRVYYLNQPVVADVIRVDRINDKKLPHLANEITYLQSRENSSNEAVIAQLVANMQSNDQTAASSTSGLSAQLISFTPAEWDANHSLLNGPTAQMLIAVRAIRTSETDLAEALHYLSHPHAHQGRRR